jgi:alcohol dehydrogenase (cytochrome c)
MRSGHYRSLALVLGAGTALMAAPAFAADVTPARLVNADKEPQNWLMNHRTYDGQRFSPLAQINKGNVKGLRLAYSVALGGRAGNEFNEATPLAEDGFLYTVDSWGVVYKIDARSGDMGQIMWRMDPKEEKQVANRGVALWGKFVISIANYPARIIATDKDNGKVVWETNAEFGQPEVSLRGAPLAIKDKILFGAAGGSGGIRDWLAAVDAATGKIAWRKFTVPAPGEPGSETWKGNTNSWETGGGAVWVTGTYDPETNQTVWGTGNPVPEYDPQARPGDNRYTNSAVAIDVNTGKLVWYYQYLPNDSWDYDEVGVQMLYDLNINGEPRKVIGHFGRNGFFYTLDRANGSFIRGGQYVNDLNWTKGLDPKTGKPIEYDPGLDVQKYVPEARAMRGDPMKRTCPTWHGGVAYQPTAYNPVKHIAYGVGAEGCFSGNGAAAAFKGPDGGLDRAKFEKRSYTSDLYYGAITAYDAVTSKVLAKTVTDIEVRSGATVTAGGLLFSALQDGWVVAYDDEKLQELWRFNVGTPLKGAPVVFGIGPKQYLAVQSSGRHLHPVKYDNLEHSSYLFVFALN